MADDFHVVQQRYATAIRESEAADILHEAARVTLETALLRQKTAQIEHDYVCAIAAGTTRKKERVEP